jgi:hypothetical protein
MRKVILLTVFIASISACNNKDNIPNGILPKDQMQSVLWDVMQAESYTNSFIIRGYKKNLVIEDAKLQEQIFSIHHISKEDFYKSYNYYKEHTNLLLAVLDSITAQQNRNENTRQALKVEAHAKIDSVKAKARADSIKVNGVKNKNLSLTQKLIPPIDSAGLKSKQKAKLKKHSPKKHKIIPALKTS